MTMRRAVAAVLALLGAIWIFQGVGYLPGSFMSGDPTWAVIGAAVVLAAVALAFVSPRR